MTPDPREMVVQANGQVRQAGSDFPGKTPDEYRAMAEQDLYFLTKAILGWKDLVGHLHGKVCKLVQTVPPRFKLFLLPRNHFKTTISEGLGIHLIIQPRDTNIYLPNLDGCNTRILYAGETEQMAQDRTSWIRRQFEPGGNKLLRAFWPHRCWDDPRRAKVTWNNSAFVVPRTEDFVESTFECVGVGGASTGSHYDVIIKDDLVAIKAMNSSVVMKDAIEWHHSSRNMKNNPDTWLEFIFGTRWGAYDLYQDIIDHDDSKHGGSVEVYTRAIVENGEPIFPERYSMKAIESEHRKLKESGQEHLFYLNLMNTVVGSGLTDFDMSLVRDFEISEERDPVVTFSGQGVADEKQASHYILPAGQTFEESIVAQSSMIFEEDANLKGKPLTAENYRTLRGRGKTGLMLKMT